MAVPYTFGSATTSIPLSQLDSNFATTITLGNTAIQLGNTVTTLNNMTLASPTLTTPALGTPASGVMTNVTAIPAAQITGSQAIPKSTLPAGTVLQVVSATKTDSFTSTTTTSFTDITGMSVSITPTSSSSKIYVTVTGTCSGQAVTSGSQIRLVRGSTAICIGDASGSTTQASTNSYQADANQSNPFSISFLDSPATTSSTTYKIQFFITSGTFYFNRTQLDANNSNGRYASK